MLAETLAAPSRRFFAGVEPLLRKRFQPLLSEICKGSGVQPTANEVLLPLYERLCSDMQSLLLAEVEVHLLPVLGMVEAIDDEIN